MEINLSHTKTTVNKSLHFTTKDIMLNPFGRLLELMNMGLGLYYEIITLFPTKAKLDLPVILQQPFVRYDFKARNLTFHNSNRFKHKTLTF